jgi:uncharacterized SAM-binding protein YcdF (DUF218 family)
VLLHKYRLFVPAALEPGCLEQSWRTHSLESVMVRPGPLPVWRKLSRWLCAAVLLLLWILSSPAGARVLLDSLERQNPDRGLEAVPNAPALVVLGGAVHAPSSRHQGSGLVDSSDRLLHVMRLYRAGKAPLVLCSGGGPGRSPEARAMVGLLEEWGVPAGAILLEERSLNTHQNGVFSYSILSARGIHEILLVTSAIHMPRAAAVFRKAGFTVIPAAADYRTGWSDEDGTVIGGLRDLLPNASSLMWSERALKEWAGLLVYGVRGWI